MLNSQSRSLRGHALFVILLGLPALLSSQQLSGSISATIVDKTGAVVRGALVTLSPDDHSPTQETRSGDDGQFSFASVAPGPFHISIAAQGFTTQSSSAIVRPGEALNLPQIVLQVATVTTDVEVTLSPAEITQEQIKAEEKQRLFGVIPNYFVSYAAQAAPLTPKQKFGLALKSTVDPSAFAIAAVIAGFEQWQNDYSGYGQGAQGYAKRYGASYADFFTGTLIGGAILPSLLKQDPRYFYKGNGTKRSRFLYAIANSVIRKSDSGRWQPDYSGILGSLASGGISNLYYPAKNRNGASLTFENAAIGIGFGALANVFQEFFFRQLTPSARQKQTGTP
jgi:carboxypeptidase family protein